LRESCLDYGPMLQECCKHVKPVAYWTRPPYQSTSSAVYTGKRVYTSHTGTHGSSAASPPAREDRVMRRTLKQPSKWIATSVLLVCGIVVLHACESIERSIKQNPQTAIGGGVGGVGGAVVGGLAGGSQGAIIGGLAGVLAGGVIGHLLDRQERTREVTVQTMAYSEAQGNLVRIEQVSISPQAIRPGETVNVNLQYSIVTPRGTGPARVREVRQIYHQGELVGNPVVQIERQDGTYWSTLPITLPARAEPGRYEVVVGVELNGALDRWETRFTVMQP
jgi:outer membrane lipoprotein SlyB